MITLKTPAELALMRAAGLVVHRTLIGLRAAATAGTSTADLDAFAAELIAAEGATPSFLGYHGYPATICTSVNDEVVHGIPSPRRILRDGDVVSIDCGAIIAGWHGDAALTVPVGEVEPALRALLVACESALWSGLAAARPDGRLSDIGHAVATAVAAAGARDGCRYGVVEEYVGHGIGTQMHEDPPVPNVAPKGPGRGPRLRPGTVLAVEPMLTLGRRQVRELADEWTVVTRDGLPAAHFEHTVAVTEQGPWVLTAPDGGATALGAGADRPAAAEVRAARHTG